VGDARLPAGARILFAGCGTSHHAALACGPAAQSLELVLGNAPDANVLVAISHEGGTRLTLEAVEGFPGETWLLTGAADSPIGRAADHVVVVTPELERSYCHTASYTCAIAAGRALQGEDVSARCRGRERAGHRPAGGHRARPLPHAAAGVDLATALEAVLKLREGAHVAAEAHETEQLLHGHLAAVDPTVRCFVLAGEARGAERAADALRALAEIGAEAALLPTTHPSWTSSASSAWPATSPRRAASTRTSSAGTRSPGTGPAGRTPDPEHRSVG
jgi:glucosamine--fructose-6-phosphate aminotransferase (isomerizing)